MGKLLVQKFGGTSLEDAKRIEVVADIIAKTISEGNHVVVVLSAMGEETDRLIELAKAIHPEPNLREYDALVATGEQISVALMAMALSKRDLKAKSYTAYQLGIRTNEMHGRARILDVKVEKLRKQIKKGVIPVITGFQGMNDAGDRRNIITYVVIKNARLPSSDLLNNCVVPYFRPMRAAAASDILMTRRAITAAFSLYMYVVAHAPINTHDAPVNPRCS